MSDDSDDESKEEENLAEVEDEEPSSRFWFEAGHSRSWEKSHQISSLNTLLTLIFQSQFRYCYKMKKA